MRAMSVVGEFRHSHIIAVTNLVMIPLNASEEYKSINILNTIAEPHTNQEGFPVEIETVVEVVESSLVLINEVGRNDRCTETEGRSTTFFLGEVDHTTAVDGHLDGDAVNAVESLVGTAEVSTSYTGIPTGAVNHKTSAEVSIPFVVVLWFLSRGLVDETLSRVNLIGEMQVVKIPFQMYVKHRSLQGEVHINISCKVEPEGVHKSHISGVQRTVVTLTVIHSDGTDTTMQLVNILVVRNRRSLVGTGKSRPLASVGKRETGGYLRARHCGVEIEWVGVELGESDVLCIYTL